MKIYVASSWRNTVQPYVVPSLRQYESAEVYDFRAPQKNGGKGFHWSEIDPSWQSWNAEEFRKNLDHELACRGFEADMTSLKEADATLLVMPCGRSAHLELGYACGRGQETAIYLPEDRLANYMVEPELMYKMAGRILNSMDEVMDWVEYLQVKEGPRAKKES